MDKRVLLLPLATILLACAATQGPGPRRSSRVLTADEIAEVVVVTAFDAVQQYRLHWLRSRASPTFLNPDGSPPVLYLDGIRLDDISELGRIRADVVERMEYLSPSEATNRYGTNHNGGAILVTTR